MGVGSQCKVFGSDNVLHGQEVPRWSFCLTLLDSHLLHATNSMLVVWRSILLSWKIGPPWPEEGIDNSAQASSASLNPDCKQSSLKLVHGLYCSISSGDLGRSKQLSQPRVIGWRCFNSGIPIRLQGERGHQSVVRLFSCQNHQFLKFRLPIQWTICVVSISTHLDYFVNVCLKSSCHPWFLRASLARKSNPGNGHWVKI